VAKPCAHLPLLDTWDVKELLGTLGTSVDRAAVLKALGTWVDLGVLKESGDEGMYVLLEEAEKGGMRRRDRVLVSPTSYGTHGTRG
jgi:hypothetical protein